MNGIDDRYLRLSAIQMLTEDCVVPVGNLLRGFIERLEQFNADAVTEVLSQACLRERSACIYGQRHALQIDEAMAARARPFPCDVQPDM